MISIALHHNHAAPAPRGSACLARAAKPQVMSTGKDAGRIDESTGGSSGIFVQSEKFVESHRGKLVDISVYGQESNATTRRLAIMNLAIRGIEADFGPEHADTFPASFQDSERGHIPKGWTAQRLPDAIKVNPRRTLKSGTVAPYLDMKNLPTQGHSAEEVIVREFSSGTKFQNGDTLLARITPCLENGKTGYVDFLGDSQVCWGSTEYIIFSPKPPLPPQFGYLLARFDALRTHAIQNMTGTSGRQRVPSECFNTFWLAVPPPAIAKRFDELTAPLMAKIKPNADQSRTLATLRDTLLPKLLSGEVTLTPPQPNQPAT